MESISSMHSAASVRRVPLAGIKPPNLGGKNRAKCARWKTFEKRNRFQWMPQQGHRLFTPADAPFRTHALFDGISKLMGGDSGEKTRKTYQACDRIVSLHLILISVACGCDQRIGRRNEKLFR